MSLNDRQKEKIRRQLFKQEKQKEEEEKLKYPAINGLINERNIFKFFIFDDDEKNSKKNDYIKLNDQIDYDINSYLNNDKLPDLYTPLGMIKGDSYKIIPYKESRNNSDKEEKENKCEKINNNIDNSHIGNFKRKKNKKIKRYFDIDFDEENDDIKKIDKNKNSSSSHLIHYSCKKCGGDDSLKCDCLTIRTFCYICLGKTHTKQNCPRLQKCFKCLKYGHKLNDCNEDLDNKCENCSISIHKKEECLKNPDRILIKDLKENNLKCRICGSEEHLICKFYNREDIILDFNDNNNKDKSNHNSNRSYISLNNSNNSIMNNSDDKGNLNINNCFSSWENGEESNKNEINNSYLNTNLSTVHSNINDYNNSIEYNDRKGSYYNNYSINNSYNSYNNYNSQYYNYYDKNIDSLNCRFTPRGNNDNCYRQRSIHNNNEKGNNYYNNYISLKEDEVNEDRKYGQNNLYNEYYNNKYNYKGYNNRFMRDNYNYKNKNADLYESYQNFKKQKFK